MSSWSRLRQLLTACRIRVWARRRLRLGDAVILDTETADLFGCVVQVSIIDLSGAVLMHSLVRAPAPIAEGAAAVHGISDLDLAEAPTLAELAPHLLAVTRGRQLLAYNAPYDRQVLCDDLASAGIDPCHLGQELHWHCLMRARATLEGTPWTKLGGPHDALGDCRATLEVLHSLAGSLR